MIGAVVAAAAMTMAATGSADVAAPTIGVRPRIELAPMVRVVGFHRSAAQTGPYTGGALGLAVDVENRGNVSVEGVVVKLKSGQQILESTLSIPARSKVVATFSDPDGLDSVCKPTLYTITLAGPSTGLVSREARITPSCSFSSSIEQTWNQMSPDRVDAQRAGNVYLSSPSMVSAPVCGKGPTMKVRIVSQAAASSPSLIVQAKEWTASGLVKAQTAAAFPLASGEQRELLLTPVTGVSGEVPAKLKLGIVDWTKSLGGRTSDGGIFVNTTRSCSLDFALE